MILLLLDAIFPSIEAKINCFQDLIEQLPTAHQYILLYLLDMLCLFSLCCENTRMDISSLATAFAPVKHDYVMLFIIIFLLTNFFFFRLYFLTLMMQ